MGPDQPASDRDEQEGWSLEGLADLGSLSDTEPEYPVADASVSTDDLFFALSKPQSRYVLTYLLMANRPVPCYELVEYVVRQTQPPEDLTAAEFRGRVLTDLLDVTCPNLAEDGLIAFDEDDQIVRETDKTVLALPHLRLALERARLEE